MQWQPAANGVPACSSWVLSTQYSVLSTQYSALSTQHSVLSTQYSVLTTHYSLLTYRVALDASRRGEGTHHLACPQPELQVAHLARHRLRVSLRLSSGQRSGPSSGCVRGWGRAPVSVWLRARANLSLSPRPRPSPHPSPNSSSSGSWPTHSTRPASGVGGRSDLFACAARTCGGAAGGARVPTVHGEDGAGGAGCRRCKVQAVRACSVVGIRPS